jgi:hypothetical protein
MGADANETTECEFIDGVAEDASGAEDGRTSWRCAWPQLRSTIELADAIEASAWWYLSDC